MCFVPMHRNSPWHRHAHAHTHTESQTEQTFPGDQAAPRGRAKQNPAGSPASITTGRCPWTARGALGGTDVHFPHCCFLSQPCRGWGAATTPVLLTVERQWLTLSHTVSFTQSQVSRKGRFQGDPLVRGLGVRVQGQTHFRLFSSGITSPVSGKRAESQLGFQPGAGTAPTQVFAHLLNPTSGMDIFKGPSMTSFGGSGV